MRFRAGQLVTAAEHYPDGSPAGREFAGRVEETGDSAAGLVALVRYDDPSVLGTGVDPYDADSGWRAWGGEQRWRIRHRACECDEGGNVPHPQHR